jgi:hypothetical protein
MLNVHDIPKPVVVLFMCLCVFVLVNSMRNMWALSQRTEAAAATRAAACNADAGNAGDDDDTHEREGRRLMMQRAIVDAASARDQPAVAIAKKVN